VKYLAASMCESLPSFSAVGLAHSGLRLDMEAGAYVSPTVLLLGSRQGPGVSACPFFHCSRMTPTPHLRRYPICVCLNRCSCPFPIPFPGSTVRLV
jgi:hypothetical protein